MTERDMKIIKAIVRVLYAKAWESDSLEEAFRKYEFPMYVTIDEDKQPDGSITMYTLSMFCRKRETETIVYDEWFLELAQVDLDADGCLQGRFVLNMVQVDTYNEPCNELDYFYEVIKSVLDNL